MEIHQLRYFIAVAERGGFSKAAAACGIAQPSLSQQIRRLEDSLGVQLLERLPRRTVLTDAGRELLPRARRILAQVDEARQELAGAANAPRLAIGAIPTIAPYVLPRVLAELSARHPSCELIVREDYTERIIAAVADTELDVALIATFPNDRMLTARPLGADHFLLVAPPHHPLAKRPGVSLAELDDEPFVVLDVVHCLGRQVGELCRSHRVRPNVVSTITQLSTALALTESGLGVTIIPRLCIAATRKRKVVTVPIRGPGASREIAAVWHASRARPAPAADLEAAVAAVVKEH